MQLWPHVSWRRWRASAAGVWRQIDEANLALFAAGIAFFALLSIFPVLAALVSIWGLFADPVSISDLLDIVRDVLPHEAYLVLSRQLDALLEATDPRLGWASILSIALAFWTGRAGVAALTRGLNAVYKEGHRTSLRRFLKVAAMTLALVVISFVAVAAIVVTPIVLAFISLEPVTAIGVRAVKWALLLITVVTSLSVLYGMGPNRRAARVRWLSPGAVFATTSWMVVSAAFSAYLENFDRYNEIYGSIGAVVALMLWLFMSAFVVLIGASINAQLELHTEPDTTIGPDRPRGERGAFVADTYVPPKGR